MGTVELWPPSPQHGLSPHLASSWKAVVGTPQQPQQRTMASMLAALARISHPHRRIQTAATFRSVQGLIGPPPTRPGLRAWSRLVLTTGLGLWLGAVMSRNMAQILEENELFVPSDDDDDD